MDLLLQDAPAVENGHDGDKVYFRCVIVSK
jgi:hypothetical protein